MHERQPENQFSIMYAYVAGGTAGDGDPIHNACLSFVECVNWACGSLAFWVQPGHAQDRQPGDIHTHML
jgi:hypothetical protein